jgi:hypothetical protein
VDRFPGSDGQHNARMLDLEPSQVPGSGDRLEDREVRGSDDRDFDKAPPQTEHDLGRDIDQRLSQQAEGLAGDSQARDEFESEAEPHDPDDDE